MTSSLLRDLRERESRLSSELWDLQGENKAIQKEIDRMVGAIMGAESDLVNARNNINTTLAEANSSLNESHSRVIEAYEIQQQANEIYRRMKNMELANKTIRDCNNKKYYEFKVYRRVRKIVQGMMDNMDFNIISEAKIEESIEKENLEQSDYWLTHVLIAIYAWKGDQKERAERALRMALQLDGQKTASFLLVFNLRLNREEAALKWFDFLTNTTLHGSDQEMVLMLFSLLPDTEEGGVSDAAKQRVNAYISKLIKECVEKSGTSRGDAINSVCDAYQRFAEDRSFSYPTITKHVHSANDLKLSISLARNNSNVINFINNTMLISKDKRNEFLKEYIDKIAEKPCAEEQRVYDEIERNELIIKHQGDVDAANTEFGEILRHRASTFNIFEELMNWVYTTEGRSKTNPQMRKSMVLLTKDLHKEAGDRYVDAYHRLFNSKTTAEVDDYSGNIDMKNPESSRSEIETFYHDKANEAKAQIKNLSAYVSFGIGVAVAVAAFYTSLSLVALSAAAVVVGVVILLVNFGKKKSIDAAHERKISHVSGVFGEIAAEFELLENEFNECDELSPELKRTLAAL